MSTFIVESGVDIYEKRQRGRKGVWKDIAQTMAAPHKNGDAKIVYASVGKNKDGERLTKRQAAALGTALARLGYKSTSRMDEDGFYRVWRIT